MNPPSPAERMIELLEDILAELRNKPKAPERPVVVEEVKREYKPNPNKPISPKQLEFVTKLITQKKRSIDQYCERFGVPALDALSDADANEIIKELTGK